MLPLLEQIDTARKEVGQKISRKKKGELGQFLTPAGIARFMASLFASPGQGRIELLDPGAGIGSLSGAFLDRLASNGSTPARIAVTAYEIDATLRDHLTSTLEEYHRGLGAEISILSGDFIEEAVKAIREQPALFSHAILNPPYKKIHSASRHRQLLRDVGIEVVNLYSAFMALTIKLMCPGGQIVAIIPRSFCNGPYYKPFRDLILSKTAIRHIHLFAARNRAFRDDRVLQENIIILLERGTRQGKVRISTSTDDGFDDIETYSYPFDHIVFKDDPGHFIHIPTSPATAQLKISSGISSSLSDIGLEVSTGPVVDFRVKMHIRQLPEPGTVPLLYPGHFSRQCVVWPKRHIRKPNAIVRNTDTEKWLYPNGFYVVVRRFSSKEEPRRVVANIVTPDIFDSPLLGFENHLNVFHFDRKGIQENLARGLAAFLNSQMVDEQFRRFSGHTQVNATDLRLLKYPNREHLSRLGAWLKDRGEIPQHTIDRRIERLSWVKTTT